MNLDLDLEDPSGPRITHRRAWRWARQPTVTTLSPEGVARIDALLEPLDADASADVGEPWEQPSIFAGRTDRRPQMELLSSLTAGPSAAALDRSWDAPSSLLAPIRVRRLHLSPSARDAVVISGPVGPDCWLPPKLTAFRRACAEVVDAAMPGQTIILAAGTHVGGTRELLVEPLEGRGFTVGRDIHVAFWPGAAGQANAPSKSRSILGGATRRCAAVASSFVRRDEQSEIVDTLEEAEASALAAQRRTRLSDAVKRGTDVVASLLALAVLWPVLLAVAIAIRLDDGGPVVFMQERLGKNGRPFQVRKFRTMVVDAEAKLKDVASLNLIQGPGFQLDRDPRLTRIGAFLRKSSLDELPQLWNVLRGDMSLVGPRPAPQVEVSAYEPWHRGRLAVKPGITGLAQIRARSYRDFDQKAMLDLEYIVHWSLWLDLRIMLQTVPLVLRFTGR